MDPAAKELCDAVVSVAAVCLIVLVLGLLFGGQDMVVDQAPLAIGLRVEVISGPHAGLVGDVMELAREAGTGRETVLLKTQLGEWICAERDDVVAL